MTYLLGQGEEILMQCQHSSVEGAIVGVPWDHAGVFLHAVPLTCRERQSEWHSWCAVRRKTWKITVLVDGVSRCYPNPSLREHYTYGSLRASLRYSYSLSTQWQED